MKRIAALLLVLLGSVSFSAANTITLDSGEGKMFGFATFPSYQFIFTAPHAYIEVETGPFGLLGDWPDAPGLQNCLPCDPRANLTLLYDSGNTGLMQFDAISFVSSLALNGDLKVIYTATARFSKPISTATCVTPVPIPVLALTWCGIETFIGWLPLNSRQTPPILENGAL